MLHPEIYLIRHGETEWDRNGVFQGQMESDLTPAGVAQVQAAAAQLAPELAGRDNVVFQSSPLRCCKQTTAIICNHLGWDFQTVLFDERLMERSFGRWEGRTRDEVDERYPDDWGNWVVNRTVYVPVGGESFKNAKSRLLSWLAVQDRNACYVVVTHREAGKALRGTCRGLDDEKALDLDDSKGIVVHLKSGEESLHGGVSAGTPLDRNVGSQSVADV